MPLHMLLKEQRKINMQDHGMAKNVRAVNMSKLQYQANLEMILQFWYFLWTTEKETPKFACNSLEESPVLCKACISTVCFTLPFPSF